jgi:hypothetical protein
LTEMVIGEFADTLIKLYGQANFSANPIFSSHFLLNGQKQNQYPGFILFLPHFDLPRPAVIIIP